jgi:four helix bundle protein
MRNYRELKVWEKAHAFALRVYSLTQNFPRTEIYGLTNQIRRACVSIPSNIVEGCGRTGNPDFARFLDISLGSANEVDYQLLLAKDLAYLKDPEYESLSREVEEIQKMLTTFILKLRPPASG